MVSTYTSSNRFTLQGTGDNASTWGQVANTVFQLIEDTADGLVVVDVSAANVTLTTANGSTDQARKRTLQIIGNPGTKRTVIVPDQIKNYQIDNLTSVATSVIIKNISGSGVTLLPNDKAVVYCDGTSTRALVRALPVISVSNTSWAGAPLSLINGGFGASASTLASARTNLGLGSAAVLSTAQILAAAYPIGSVYINASDGTNPSSLLGFGTWVATATGRVLLGVGTGVDINGVNRTFTSAGSTGGEYEHTLTAGEGAVSLPTKGATGSTSNGVNAGSFNDQTHASFALANQANVGTSTLDVNGTSHNNIQPYVTVFFWQRTA